MNPHMCAKFGADRSSGLATFPHLSISYPLKPPKCPLGHTGKMFISPITFSRWICMCVPNLVPIGPQTATCIRLERIKTHTHARTHTRTHTHTHLYRYFFLQQCPSEPLNALVFCSTQLSKNGVAVPSRSSRRHRAAKMDKLEIVDYLRSVLPPHCRLVSIASNGIIGKFLFVQSRSKRP